MIVLVANLGSTSFKCKLIQMQGGQHQELAAASADRIGLGQSHWRVGAADRQATGVDDLPDHAAAIQLHLDQLVRIEAIDELARIDAIGFKAVHGGAISGAVAIDAKVLATMEQFNDVAPQHNPPYIAAMKALKRQLPHVPQVAAFETAFHQTIPMARQVYGVPYEWVSRLGIRRYGFHGASHRYIANRMAEVAPEADRLISCHLGGSCSVCAIRGGRSQANSFGMTTQTGVFHASRAGDFDTFALLKLLESGLKLPQIWQTLGTESGLAGLSGISSDLRQVQEAAQGGNRQAQLSLDAFVESVRHYLGAYLAVLNGADALIFTGGIGQHAAAIRAAICDRMDYAGITLDRQRNDRVKGDQETRIDSADSRVAVWVMPTNEELIVARQTVEVLAGPTQN